jgi:Tryptophan-associated transmembrane protein (Trp_oprn_chp)
MQNGRIRLGQLIAFCGGLVLLATLSQTWFRPVADYRGVDALEGPQTAWQAFDRADNALAFIAVAALVLIVVMAVTHHGGPARVLLLVLGAAGVVIVFFGAAPFVGHELLEPARAEAQTAVWVAGAASLSLVAGAHGLPLPAMTRPERYESYEGATYYDDTIAKTGFSNPAERPERDLWDTLDDVERVSDALKRL